jgi:hypothetical protein
MQYDIDNYNCTDWALAVFNKQGYGLDIPLYDIPGTYPSAGTSMPQGIYNKLQQMKNSGDPHADKIQIGFYKGYVTSSDGRRERSKRVTQRYLALRTSAASCSLR